MCKHSDLISSKPTVKFQVVADLEREPRLDSDNRPSQFKPVQLKSKDALGVLVGQLFSFGTPWQEMFKSADLAVGMDEMSSKQKCHQKWNVTKTEISKNWNVTKTEMSPKPKCHKNLNITKTEMSSKLKCHQNWKVTRTVMFY